MGRSAGLPNRRAFPKYSLERSQKAGIRKAMKKLILSLVMVGFAVAVQAGEGKACASKDKAACSSTKLTEAGCCSSTSVTKTSTCKGKQVVMSPKGAEQSVKLIASR
jgi:hypothetical protein